MKVLRNIGKNVTSVKNITVQDSPGYSV